MIRVNSQSFSLSSTLRKKSHDDKPVEPKISKSQSFPIQSKHQQLSDSLRLHYVTQRILASVLPRRDSTDPDIIRPHSVGHGGLQDKHEKELISMLEQKHGKNYRVFDLESCISVITLERICELCKHIDSWLGSGQEKVVVLQDRGDRQRIGVAIAAYLEYLDICASNYTPRNGKTANEDMRAQNTIARNWLDLDIFSMKKFLEDFISPLRVPTHKRYLRYFSGLLSGKIKMNSSPVHLKYISFQSPPSWLQYERDSSQGSEWNSFIKIYEGLRCVYTSDIHIIPITTQQFLYQIGSLRLRGDIIIKCYQIIVEENSYEKREKRELLFSVQFHTCAITTNDVYFARQDLDFACDDPRFPNDHKIILHFNKPGSGENNYVFQSPLIRTEPSGELGKYDSLENLDSISSYHTGPVDGSLYATIAKSPKSPQFHTTRQIESLNASLISPPPQFSNKQYDITKKYSENSAPSRNTNTIERKTVTTSNTSNINRSSSTSNSRQYLDNRPGTSQSCFREKRYDPGRQQITIVETFTTTDGGGTGSGGGGGGGSHVNQNGGRDSVRSPLTLSMDSGISSSGVLNRRVQGSSVSPSSLPSQASPQEDRHRELDDILTDMLMTVQDIPDFSKSSKQQQTTTHRIVRSQSVIPTSGNFAPTPATSNLSLQFGGDPVPRSQSCLPHESASVHTSSTYLNRDRDKDVYDTSSTTTTLTPPPSESGRDTPINVYNSDSGSMIALQQNHNTIQREKRETYLTNTLTTTTNINQSQHRDNMIMDLQHQHQQQQRNQYQHHNHHQSSSYPQTVRTEEFVVSGTSEDEENIPYHAREHSQPFTYGNVPVNNGQLIETRSADGTRMIKMQSGLSSPSLVRKTVGGSQTTLRKTSPRNDFEEMLRERREKVMSEKYSISDKQKVHDSDHRHKTFDRSYSNDTRWLNNNSNSVTTDYTHQTNGYHYYHEPLKRSNTIEGGFGRSNSTDGLSGQTWLQLQQQKLRAKKEQQLKEDRRYYEETIHTEIRNRPLRSRANVSQRYDGYASDTAAFADEVDYRRPLHVQTPYPANRSSDRNYHTLTTTSTVTQKERPFVSVKRAHEQSKRDAVGSPPMSPLSILNASPNGHIAHAQTQAQNGLLSMADQSRNGHARLVREESFSSFRSETDPELSIAGSPRPETPAFPVTPRTPYGLSNGNVSPALPPKSPTTQRKDLYSGTQRGHMHEVINQNDTISNYTSRRNSNTSNANSEPQEVAPHHVKFVKDSSKYWYKPNISREEAVSLLRNASPGTFIVRDSTTFKSAFGLVLRVAHPPPGVTLKSPSGDELVRHFLVEPTSRGVRLKGCANEPVFTSLSALVYQHSITPLALPCRLLIPDRDLQPVEIHSPAQKQLLAQGAACNVLYLFACETESLTGEEAVRKAVSQLYYTKPLPSATEVHFKVSHQGITLTDVSRQKFFRKHYSANVVSHCGLDPEKRLWSIRAPEGEIPINNKTIFAFVARRSASSNDNQCHVFCDLSPSQPATAIISFANKVLPTDKIVNQHI